MHHPSSSTTCCPTSRVERRYVGHSCVPLEQLEPLHAPTQDLNAHNVSNIMHALGVLRHVPRDDGVLPAIDAMLPNLLDDMTIEVCMM